MISREKLATILRPFGRLMLAIGGLFLFFSWLVNTFGVEQATEAKHAFQNVRNQRVLYDDLEAVMKKLNEMSYRMAFSSKREMALAVGATEIDRQTVRLASLIEIRFSFMEGVREDLRRAKEVQDLANEVGDNRSASELADVVSQFKNMIQRSENNEKKYGNSITIRESSSQADREAFVSQAAKFLAEEWDSDPSEYLSPSATGRRGAEIQAHHVGELAAGVSNALSQISQFTDQQLRSKESREAQYRYGSRVGYVIGTILVICGGFLKP